MKVLVSDLGSGQLHSVRNGVEEGERVGIAAQISFLVNFEFLV